MLTFWEANWMYYILPNGLQKECLCTGLGAIFSLTSEQNVDQTLQLSNSLLFV